MALSIQLDVSRKNIITCDDAAWCINAVKLGSVWYNYGYLAGTDLKVSLSIGTAGTTTWEYEQTRDLLTSVTHHFFDSDISSYSYTNDAAGRRTSKNDETYGYNERDELTSVTTNSISTYAYSYDDIGNRLSSNELGEVREYAANSLNQYIGDDYDLDGNQTNIVTTTGTWAVTYNAENRPVNWQCGATNIVMKYDYMGRRVEYIETISSVTNAHHKFVYDGYLQIQRLNGSDNSVDLAFEWDPTEPIATRPLFMQQRNSSGNPLSYFFTHDGNKNVSDVVSYQRARGVVAHYDYAPFGAVTSATGSLASTNPFRFSSEYHDDTLGLVYYNYRPYNPLEGRWISRDIDTISDENKYLFVVNCPIVSADYIGLTCVVDDEKFPGATWCQECKLWVRKFNDNRDVQLRLVRESRDEHNKKIKAAKDDIAKLITMQRAWLAGILDRIEQECSFDTKYQKEWNKYFWIDGEDEVYRGNEINYIGIGMFEKANNIGPREWVVYSWKILNYKELPSAGTLYWYNKGFEIE